MARILAIDYGRKRTGVAVTDPLQIIASGLDTVPTHQLFTFLNDYFKSEQVESIVLGMPTNLDTSDTDTTAEVRNLKKKLEEKFPEKNIFTVDERYTSKMAIDAMVRGGMKKKDRRKKENVDRISAVIILQSYLESKGL